MRTRPAILIVAFAALWGGLTARAATDAPLVEAAARGDTGVVRNLLRRGADVNQARGDGMTALHQAAERGDATLAGLLIYAGAEVEAGTRIGGYTPLHVAARGGHAAVVDVLLAAGADAAAVTVNSGVQPLHLAAAAGSTRAVASLIDAGADVDARAGEWAQTPLIFAAAADRAEIIRQLLVASADPSLASAVADAAEREKADEVAKERLMATLAEFRRQEGGGPSWQPNPGQVRAAIGLEREIQRKWPDVPLADCEPADGADDGPAAAPEAADPRDAAASACAEGDEGEPERKSYGELVGEWGGLTPLLHAVRQGHEDAALALLEGGADIDQPSAGDGTTPLLMAAVNGQFDLALLLIERGADPNLTSDAGTGALFAALERQWAPWANYAHPVEHHRQASTYLDVLKALLEAGADPNVRLNRHLWYSEFTISVLGGQAGLHYEGATPFWRAALALDVPAMRLLKAHGADPGVPTKKVPERRRRNRKEEDRPEDPTGLAPVPVGGPNLYPIHAATGAGYGQSFAANAHKHVPDNWLPAVRFLVEECGADVNLRDANGYTPLHHAASRGDNETIRYLVGKGGDVTVVSRSGQTTADMANGPIQRVPPFPETIALLVSLGAVNNDKCVSC